MKTKYYNYTLPDELIALEPSPERDACRLLVVDKKTETIEHKVFSNIVDYLKQGDVLVLNDTKVLNARIYANRQTGAKIEIVLLQSDDFVKWEVLTNRSKRLKMGDRLQVNDDVFAEIEEVKENGIKILKFNIELTPKLLSEIGEIPLPPYIKTKRKPDLLDNTWYQTVFSKNYGSKASPTAGLHFTDELLLKLKQKGVIIEYITLHISLSTFNPIRTDDIDDHVMHTEYFEVSEECVQTILTARKKESRVFAVGTTVIRALESAAKQNELKSLSGYTDLFIKPGYKFKVCDAVITNFHTPNSTLLVLVSAFAGNELIKKVYKTAIKEKYRFLSYGDSMLIF